MRTERLGIAELSGLGDPIRRRLYEYVSDRGQPVARDEAAEAAGIGRSLAAYHLDKLVTLGLLTAAYQRPGGRGGPGAGRPAKVYVRSERELAVTLPPREYELAAQLLAEAVTSDPGGASQAALLATARRVGAELGRRGAGSAGEAAQAMRGALRELGFEPVTAGDGTLLLRNCPFRQLAARHPEIICAMNLALISGLLTGLGAVELRPELRPVSGRCCVTITGCRTGGSRTGGSGTAGKTSTTGET